MPENCHLFLVRSKCCNHPPFSTEEYLGSIELQLTEQNATLDAIKESVSSIRIPNIDSINTKLDKIIEVLKVMNDKPTN